MSHLIFNCIYTQLGHNLSHDALDKLIELNYSGIIIMSIT